MRKMKLILMKANRSAFKKHKLILGFSSIYNKQDSYINVHKQRNMHMCLGVTFAETNGADQAIIRFSCMDRIIRMCNQF